MKSRPHGIVTARRLRLPLVIGTLLVPALAHAHVKWFSQFTYADRPRALREVVTPTFLALAALSTVVVGGLAFADVDDHRGF